jgi:CRISPR-associated protein Csm4
MMKTYRILLKPKGIIKDIPSSETLFGAICWGVRTLYGEKELVKILNDYEGSKGKFIPSSACPLLKSENGVIYCFPKPVIPDPEIKEMDETAAALKSKIIQRAKVEIKEENKLLFSKRIVLSQYRSFNKTKYLPESLFNRLVKGEKIIKLYYEYLEEELKIIKGGILITANEFAKIGKESLMESRISARNKIDRLSFSTVPGGELYYEEEIYLNPRVFHLYFFLLTEDIDFFDPIFRWLSDTGIGGNRTVGRGYYEIKNEGEVKLPDATDKPLFIPLSKYLPAENEIDWDSEKNYYQLIPYQPRFDTMFFKGGEFIKERVTYLKEGSILQAKAKKEYYGRLYPAAKFQNQTIYQCGLTIPVFLKMAGQ